MKTEAAIRTRVERLFASIAGRKRIAKVSWMGYVAAK